MTEWVTVSQASDMLGMSERSVRRHIAEGKVESKIEENRRLVKVDTEAMKSSVNIMPISDKDALIKWLQNELEQRNRQIERLQEEIRNNQQRANDIIMKLADELEAQRNILEGILEGRNQPKRKRDESFWHRIRSGTSGTEE